VIVLRRRPIDEDGLFRDQLKPLYKERICVNLIKQELEEKGLLSCSAVGKPPG